VAASSGCDTRGIAAVTSTGPGPSSPANLCSVVLVITLAPDLRRAPPRRTSRLAFGATFYAVTT
jgi:hypothetical protein